MWLEIVSFCLATCQGEIQDLKGKIQVCHARQVSSLEHIKNLIPLEQREVRLKERSESLKKTIADLKRQRMYSPI
jgi:K+/H+ antiporter YhaU regulatory subunit KhtT